MMQSPALVSLSLASLGGRVRERGKRLEEPFTPLTRQLLCLRQENNNNCTAVSVSAAAAGAVALLGQQVKCNRPFVLLLCQRASE